MIKYTKYSNNKNFNLCEFTAHDQFPSLVGKACLVVKSYSLKKKAYFLVTKDSDLEFLRGHASIKLDKIIDVDAGVNKSENTTSLIPNFSKQEIRDELIRIVNECKLINLQDGRTYYNNSVLSAVVDDINYQFNPYSKKMNTNKTDRIMMGDSRNSYDKSEKKNVGKPLANRRHEKPWKNREVPFEKMFKDTGTTDRHGIRKLS